MKVSVTSSRGTTKVIDSETLDLSSYQIELLEKGFSIKVGRSDVEVAE